MKLIEFVVRIRSLTTLSKL